MADFVRVCKRNKRKHNKNSVNTTFDIRLDNSMSELKMSLFYQKTIEKLRKVLDEMSMKKTGFKEDGKPKIDLMCYGLGNIMDSYIARYQLALLKALRLEFETEIEDCEVYDPVFTVEEKNFLHTLDMTVTDVNKEGKQRCNTDRVTVYYMPHCGKALYNNVLWSNWNEDYLQHIIIIGNSFTKMIERTPSRILSKTAGYVMKIHPYTVETELDCASDFDNIFNDTSIHMFNTQEVPRELWEENTEPVYESDDSEIIFASNMS